MWVTRMDLSYHDVMQVYKQPISVRVLPQVWTLVILFTVATPVLTILST